MVVIPSLVLLLAAQPQHAARALQSALHAASNLLPAGRDAADNSIPALSDRSGRGGDVAALVVAALALGAVDALLGRHIADGLGEAALADLTGDEVVDAVLEGVDLLYACDFGLVEVFCRKKMFS